MELPATVPNPSLRPVDPDGRETLAFSVGVQRHDRFSGIALFKGPNYSPCKEFNLACCKRNAVRFAGGNGPCQMFGHGWYAVVRPRKPLGRTDRNNFREPILRVSSSGEQPAVLRRNHGDIQQGRHLVGHRWNDFRGRDVHGRERHRQLHGDRHEHGGHIQAISGDGGCYRGAATASSPTTASSAPTPGTASSISKDGITWTFSQAVPVGQFVNGDYYVVGPVTITAIDPAPTTSTPFETGSVVDLPTANGKSGFDSRLNDGTDESWWFDATLRSYPPITLNAGDSLVSSISLATIHSVPQEMRASDMSASPVASVSVLTVLATAPSADAFLAVLLRSQPDDLSRECAAAKSVAVSRATNPFGSERGHADAGGIRGTVSPAPIHTNAFLFDAPANYMPSYGQHVAFADSYASLLLTLNFTADQKVNLTNYFVQYGIDLYGCVQTGYGWPAFGGHHSGRKLPIVFAGILLNNSGMKNVSALYPNQFGEDMQTLYINQLAPAGSFQQAWQGAMVIYGGHYGVDIGGQPVSAGLYGPYEQLQPANWPLINGNEQLGEAYRRCCTSVSWVGEALTIHLLHAESVWSYPAFFDYVDRWMTEDDAQAVAEIKAQTGFDYSADWERQGQTRFWLQGEVPQYTFIDDMWTAYRQ